MRTLSPGAVARTNVLFENHARARKVLLALTALAVTPLASCSRGPAPEEVLLRLPIESPADLLAGSGVAIDATITSDGNGAARIEAAGPMVIRIAETELPVRDLSRLIYRARLRTENLDGRTFLEMWCAIPGKGEYFSRALHDPLTGTVAWTTQETPFILKEGQSPSRVRLNLAIEGSGTVWIDDVVLTGAPR